MRMLKVTLPILAALAWATLLITTVRLWGVTDSTARLAFVCSLATLPIPALVYYLKRPVLVSINAAYVLVIVLLGVIESLRHAVR